MWHYPNMLIRFLKHWDTWISGANIKTMEETTLLMKMEQFLEGLPKDLQRYIQDGKPNTITKVGRTRARWLMVMEGKESWQAFEGVPEGAPMENHHQGQAKGGNSHSLITQPHSLAIHLAPVTSQLGDILNIMSWGTWKLTAPRAPPKCNSLHWGQTKRPQAQMSPGYPQSKGKLSVSEKMVIAWRDTGAQVSAIHQSLMDPELINPESKVIVQLLNPDSFDLPTSTLPVTYKGCQELGLSLSYAGGRALS